MPGPLTYDGLIETISRQHSSMSKHFQQIARYLVQNPNEAALSPLKALGKRAEVQPSTFVRFAQSLGYAGFKEMQRVMQSRLLSASPGFHERLALMRSQLGASSETTNLAFARNLAAADIAAIEGLLEGLAEEDLGRAAVLMRRAPTIWVFGRLRATGIANYLFYALTHLGKDARLVDNIGDFSATRMRLIKKNEVLAVINFQSDDSTELIDIARTSKERGARVISVTDNALGALSDYSELSFEVREGNFDFLGSHVAALSLVQMLVVGLAYKLNPEQITSGTFHDFDPLSW